MGQWTSDGAEGSDVPASLLNGDEVALVSKSIDFIKNGLRPVCCTAMVKSLRLAHENKKRRIPGQERRFVEVVLESLEVNDAGEANQDRRPIRVAPMSWALELLVG